MKKRIISLLMCLVMTFSLLPTAAWAELAPAQGEEQPSARTETVQAAAAAPQSGESGVSVQAGTAVAEADGRSFSTLQAAFDYAVNEAPGFPTIKLLDNVTLDECIYPSGGVTLDLNGKTVSRAPKEYTMGGNDVSVFCVQSGGRLTIKDTVGGGQIVQPNIFAAVTANGGTVTIESGTIKATSTDTTNNRAIEVSSGTVTINGGTIEGAQLGVRTWGGSKLIVNGGTIHGGESYALWAGGGDVQLSGGTFTTGVTDGCSIWNEKGTAASLLKSGYAYMTDAGEESPISADGYKVQGKTTVQAAPERVTYIAADGTEQGCAKYTEITSETTILQGGGWYVVKKDVATSDFLKINGYKSTFNLILCDGATLTTGGPIVSTDDQSTLNIYLQSGGTGKLHAAYGVSSLHALTVNRVGTPMKLVNEAGKATSNLESWFEISKCDHDRFTYTEKNEKNHTGTCAYCGTSLSDEHEFTWAYKDADTHTGTCKVCGYVSTVKHEMRYTDNHDGLTHKSFCRDCDLTPVNKAHRFQYTTYGQCVDCYVWPAAEVDGTIYSSLPIALNAAKDGDTVKLLANHVTNWSDVDAGDNSTLAVVTKKLTLDLCGKSVDWLEVGEMVSDEEGGILDSTDGDLTIVDNTDASRGMIQNLAFKKGTLNIQGGEIGKAADGSINGKLACGENSGSVTISDGAVFALKIGEGSSVTVSGGSGHGGNWFNDGTLNITGGTFRTVDFHNNGGTIAIRGGEFGAIKNNGASTTLPAMELLEEGYAFFGKDADDKYTVLQDGSAAKELTDVVVKEHTHTIENGKCACGASFAASVTAKDGTVSGYYATLEEAFQKADSNSTVTLLTDTVTENVTFDGGDKSVTLNMNGKTLTAPNNDNSALTVSSGTLTITGAATISNPVTSDPYNQNLKPAITLSGGKLVFTDKLTAQGGVFNIPGNATAQEFAVNATGGELDFRGDLDLEGGLKITGSATLTNKLTKGTFRIAYSRSTSLSVEGAKNYKYLHDLLKDGYAYVDKDDPSVFRCVHSFISWAGSSVTIVPHTHTWEPGSGDNYQCKDCKKSCAHEGGYKTGKCEVCGKPCPHASTKQNTDYKYYCDDCGQEMVARIVIGQFKWSHFPNLTDALKAAENGQTVLLLVDTALTKDAYLYKEDAATADDMVVTLDLNGHNVTQSGWASVLLGEGACNTSTGTAPKGPFKLIVRGSGNFEPNIRVTVKAALDLSGWTGGTIGYVELSDDRNVDDDLRKQTSFIVGKDAGTIGQLAFGNWQLGPEDTANAVNLSGGSYGTILISGWTANQISLGDLLASGYAFKNTASGEYVPYDKKLTTDEGGQGDINDLTVVPCPHTSITNGTCDYCNKTGIVAAVNDELYENFADAQSAWLADGGTLKLYQNVSGMTNANWAGDSSKEYTLDLNGYSIVDDNKYNDGGTYAPNWKITVTSMDLTVKDTSEKAEGQLDNLLLSDNSTLTLQSGWLGELTVPKGNNIKVQLKGGGLKHSDIKGPLSYVLPDGYDLLGAADLSAVNDRSSKDYTVQKAPASFDGSKEGTMPLGKNNLPFAPTVTMNTGAAEPAKITVAWYLWDGSTVKTLADGTMTKSGSTWTYDSSKENAYYQAYDNLAVGNRYEVFAVVKAADSSDKDLWRAAITGYQLTITKADLSDAVVTLDNTEEYVVGDDMMFLPQSIDNKNGKTLTQKVSVTLYDQTLKEGTDYIVSGNTGTNAGDYTLTVTAAEGSALYTGSTTKGWRIAPFPLRYAYVQLVKTYDGTAKVNVADATVRDFTPHNYSFYAGIEGMEKGVDYQLSNISPNYPSADWGKYTGMHATVTLLNENYVFSNGEMVWTWDNTDETPNDDCKIDYAAAPADVNTTLTVTNDHVATYTLDVSRLLPPLPAGCTYGDPTWYLIKGVPSEGEFVSLDSRYYDEDTATIGEKTGILTLPIKAVNSDVEGTIGTVKVKVQSRNYYSFNINITVNAKNKLMSTGAPTLDKTAITYGDTIGSIRLTGSMKAGETTVNGTFSWDNGSIKPDAGTYEAAWTFTPADTGNYQIVTGKSTITVAPATLTNVSVMQRAALTYTGLPQSAPVTEKATAVNGQKVTFEYSLKKDSEYGSGVPALTEAGTHTVYYKATAANHAEYKGSFTVTIGAKSLSDATITLGESLTYNGQQQTQTITSVIVGTLTLTEGKDYTVSGNTGKNAQGYTLTITGKDNYTGTADKKFTIAAADLTGVNVTAESLTYTGTGQIAKVTTAAAALGGETVTFTYSSKETGPYTAAVPTFIGAGTHTVYYKANAANHNEATGSFTVTIGKATPTVTAPRANTLAYTGADQALVTTGSTTGGTLRYSLEENGTYTATIPTGKNANDYRVWYKVVGDNNYNDVAAQYVDVTIRKATPTVTAPKANTLTYTGEEQALVTAGSTTGGAMQYSLEENGTYTDTIPTGKNAANYTVWYKVVGDSNYNSVDAKSISVTIAPRALTADDMTVSTPSDVTYNGAAQQWAPEVKHGETVLTRDTDYTVAYDKTDFTNVTVGSITVTITGKGNFTGTVTRSYRITALNITNDATVNVELGEALIYNGRAQTQTVASVKVGELLIPAGTYTVTGNTDKVEAGTYTLTVTVDSGNFTGTTTKEFPVNKAVVENQSTALSVVNNAAKDYTVDLSALLPALKVLERYGTISYGTPVVDLGSYYTSGASIDEKGLLTLPIRQNAVTTTGSIGTVTVTVSSTNFADFTLTVNVSAENKAIPTGEPTLSRDWLRYGETIGAIRLSGSMKDGDTNVPGTFQWVTPNVIPGTESVTAEWIFTPADTDRYTTASGSVTLTVKEIPEDIHSVSGSVIYVQGKDGATDVGPVAGADVAIIRGTKTLSRTTTDASGNFSLAGVPSGEYNIVVTVNTNPAKTVTAKLVLTAEDGQNVTMKDTIKIRTEDINSKLDVSKSPFDIVVGGLDQLAEDVFDQGGVNSVTASMTIEQPATDRNDPHQKAILEKAAGKTLDLLHLALSFNEKQVQSDGMLELIIPYDTSRSGIKVYRSLVDADGKATAEELADSAAQIDKENGCIRLRIPADQLGLYAIGYTPVRSGGSGSSAAKDDVTSAETFDSGVMFYAALALTSLSGLKVLRKKREED